MGVGAVGGGGFPRRNSLGDLEIPARIGQAQVGLKRDLGTVRLLVLWNVGFVLPSPAFQVINVFFDISELKEIQNTYNTLVVEVRALDHTCSSTPTCSATTTATASRKISFSFCFLSQVLHSTQIKA